jgi:hypothetical protein
VKQETASAAGSMDGLGYSGGLQLGNRMQTTAKRQASRSKSRLRLRVLKFRGAASLGFGGSSLKMEKEM